MFLNKKKRYLSKVETLTGKRKKYFQSGNGEDLKSNELNDFHGSCRIQRLPWARTPQQNGKAESMSH